MRCEEDFRYKPPYKIEKGQPIVKHTVQEISFYNTFMTVSKMRIRAKITAAISRLRLRDRT